MFTQGDVGGVDGPGPPGDDPAGGVQGIEAVKAAQEGVPGAGGYQADRCGRFIRPGEQAVDYLVHGAVTTDGAETIHFRQVEVPDNLPGVAGILGLEDSEIDPGGIKDGLDLPQDSRSAFPAPVGIDRQAKPFRGRCAYLLTFR